MERGRPTSYDAAYCERVIEYGKQGKSRTWIAAELGCTRQTLGNWEQANPDFLHAMEISNARAQQWWEDAGQVGMCDSTINASIWSRSMAARFPAEWREKQLVGSDPDNPLPAGVSVTFKGAGQ